MSRRVGLHRFLHYTRGLVSGLRCGNDCCALPFLFFCVGCVAHHNKLQSLQAEGNVIVIGLIGFSMDLLAILPLARMLLEPN